MLSPLLAAAAAEAKAAHCCLMPKVLAAACSPKLPQAVLLGAKAARLLLAAKGTRCRSCSLPKLLACGLLPKLPAAVACLLAAATATATAVKGIGVNISMSRDCREVDRGQ